VTSRPWPPPESPPEDLDKGAYRTQLAASRVALLKAQQRLRRADASALVLIAGVDGAGKGETVNLLNGWMDPRRVQTHAFDQPSDEERERPAFWRYWRALPPRGHVGLFLSAWYSEPLLRRVHGLTDEPPERELDRIRSFEQTLADAGVRVLKFWLHLGKDAQERRFRELERDPLERWRVTERDWRHWSLYERFAAATEQILSDTHTERCPWIVIDGAHPRRRTLAVAGALAEALRAPPEPPAAVEPETRAVARRAAVEPEADAEALAKRRYQRELARWQGALNGLHRRARALGLPVVCVFEGRDASGKGGAIRRVVSGLDARSVRVARIGPPTDEERAHHYLWRFWRLLPRAGRVLLCDRSWYGRVLVERVEGLAAERDWRRAYAEINEFERQLVEHGTVLVKFWLDVSKEEQAARFEERRRVRYKRWKLTEDDLRNRRLWKAYDAAIRDMLDHTGTAAAPWICIPADDKRRARIEILRGLCGALAARLRPLEGAAPAPARRLSARGGRRRAAPRPR
jgi:polyphosphate:AMP phosphotransferase